MLFRLPESFLLRFAERRFLGLLFREPPRKMRRPGDGQAPPAPDHTTRRERSPARRVLVPAPVSGSAVLRPAGAESGASRCPDWRAPSDCPAAGYRSPRSAASARPAPCPGCDRPAGTSGCAETVPAPAPATAGTDSALPAPRRWSVLDPCARKAGMGHPLRGLSGRRSGYARRAAPKPRSTRAANGRQGPSVPALAAHGAPAGSFVRWAPCEGLVGRNRPRDEGPGHRSVRRDRTASDHPVAGGHRLDGVPANAV